MKNKHQIIHLISLLAGVVLVLVGLIIFLNTIGGASGSNPDYITPLVLIGVGLVGFIVSFFAREQERKFCNKCGASMDGCAYEYEETRRTNPDDKGYVRSTVRIIGECPQCGAKKKFKKTWKMHGSRTVGDLQDEVDAYCKAKFGH